MQANNPWLASLVAGVFLTLPFLANRYLDAVSKKARQKRQAS